MRFCPGSRLHLLIHTGFVAALSVSGDKRPDPAPRGGHNRADRRRYRADRINFNRSPVWTARFEVIPAVLNPVTPKEWMLSDHHLVVADLYLRHCTAATAQERSSDATGRAEP